MEGLPCEECKGSFSFRKTCWSANDFTWNDFIGWNFHWKVSIDMKAQKIFKLPLFFCLIISM